MFLQYQRITYNIVKLLSTTATKNSGVLSDRAKTEYYKSIAASEEVSEEFPAGWQDAKPYHKIPGPKGLPVIGSMWKFVPGIGSYNGIERGNLFRRLQQDYGDISCLRSPFWKTDMVFLFSPNDFEWLFRNEGIWPQRPGFHAIEYYRNKIRPDVFKGVAGTLATQGLEWFNIRTRVNPICMQPQTAHFYVKQLDDISGEFIERIRHLAKANSKSEMPEDFARELHHWSFEAAGVIALDTRFGCINPESNGHSDALQIIHCINKIVELSYSLEMGTSIWKIYPAKTWKLLIKHMDYLTDTCIKYMNEAYERISKEATKTKKEQHEMSILERLLETDRAIALAMVIDMLTAGIDTTSSSIGSTLYFLAKNKEQQNKLRQELRQLLPHKNSPITKEVLSYASYLKATIKEVMRVAPVVMGNMRITNKPLVLAGYRIPKGSEVTTANFVASNSEQQFPRPTEFLPERWLRTTSQELSYKSSHPFSYLPFGFGPRSCVGKRLANLETEVIVAKIIRNFVLEWPHQDVKFQSTLVNAIVDPLKFRVKEFNH